MATSNRHELAALILLAACTLPPSLQARAEDEIVTDRPDFVESSLTVGAGRLQVETSVAQERDKHDGARSVLWTTPTLLRYGLGNVFELRLETDGYARLRVEDATGATTTERGYNDLDMGVKWHMRDQAGVLPSTAWLLHLTLDSGSAPFRGDDLRPSLRATMEWELPDEFSLGVMPGVAYDKDASGDRFLAGILGVVLGYGINDRLRVFGEISGQQIASGRHGGDIVTYDAGAAYLLTRTVQVDTAFFFGANAQTPDLAWTVGLSMKF